MVAKIYIFYEGIESESIPYKYEYNEFPELFDYCMKLMSKNEDIIECNAFDVDKNKMLFNGVRIKKKK